MSEGHRVVFVGGLHRSGTTLLARCLAEHPSISGFRDTGVPEDEGQFLQHVFPPARHFGGPGLFGFHPGVHLTEASNADPVDTRRRLVADWGRYWDAGRPVWLEKSPPNLLRTRFLQASFPEAVFLMMVRHPVAVAYATQKWSRTSLASGIEHWVVCHELFERDRPWVRRLLLLRYEDLVAAPQRWLDRVYQFLGLPAHPCTQEVRTHGNHAYLRRWREESWSLAGGALLETLRTHLRFEKRIRPFGYSLWEQGPCPSS